MGDQDAVRRLSPRRWRILSYLAQHGSASTLDVALVCAVSRLTAHRDLVWLYESGLVRRERSAEDRTHTWWYGVTAEGTEVLRHALTESGRPVPLLLGQRPSSAADALLFLPLVEVSRRNPGRCELFQWLATMETSSWLRQHDLAQCGPTATAYGCRTVGACGSWYTSTVARPETLSPSTSGRRQGWVDCWAATGVRTGWCRSGRFC
ncbi:DeoR family transcriptional regulator [Micromonospora sp. NPDC007208]|uniref:DeoR family transcriptional regulator n=1 Tax=Micromonospora sp. NPDC007208 TaxID=3364236 RepID=UPI0036C030C0